MGGLRGFLGGLGAGVAQLGQQGMAEQASARQVRLTAEVQAQRDARLAGYQKAQTLDERGYQAEVGAAQAASAQAAMLEQRQYEEGRSDVEHGRDIELATLDPKAPNVTVNNNAQDLDARTEEFSKAIGKADADRYEATRKGAQSAAQLEDSIHVLEEMQSRFETGKAQEALAVLGQYVGTDAGAALQAWEGTISPIVLAKAEGLSGVLSDKDMEFLRASVPQFGNDAKANAVMIGLMRKGMQRSLENERSMQEHLNENGNLNNWSAPNQQGTINATAAAETNMGAADDPLGLFK